MVDSTMAMGCKRRRRCTRRTNNSGDLPADLLDVILARLPIRDAARASVLSVAWGRLSDLDFTTSSAACDSREAIDAVLRHRSGPVRRARFRVTDANLPGVHGWTLSLISQQPEGLQGLDLAFYNSGPPPAVLPDHSIFSPACTRALRDLVLARCVLPPVPPAAAGFPSLTRLRLTLVSVHEGSDLEAMVSMSPKLEELAMTCIIVLAPRQRRRRHELRMASQSLRFLEMSGHANVDWVAACLPRVEHARLLDVESNPTAWQTFCEGWRLPSTSSLVYYNNYLKIELPKGLQSSYANLNRLQLEVNFSYAPEITSMIYFLKSAPNLTQLVVNDLITDESSEESPYQWPPLGSYEICPNLRFLRMTALSLRRNTLDFMRLVLSWARI